MGYISIQSDVFAMSHVEIGDLSEYLRQRRTYRWYFDSCSSVKGILRSEGPRFSDGCSGSEVEEIVEEITEGLF